ncbi:MAG TPA: HEAT repeat domain-containing protein, partial [Chryseolinea sp.]
VKMASIWALPNYLENNLVQNKSSIIEKLRQQLQHEHWKVRVSAFTSLGFVDLVPAGYELSLKDKLAKLVFRCPPMF